MGSKGLWQGQKSPSGPKGKAAGLNCQKRHLGNAAATDKPFSYKRSLDFSKQITLNESKTTHHQSYGARNNLNGPNHIVGSWHPVLGGVPPYPVIDNSTMKPQIEPLKLPYHKQKRPFAEKY